MRAHAESECTLTGNPRGAATLKSKSDLVARPPSVDRAPILKEGGGMAGEASLKPERAHRRIKYGRWGRPAPDKGGGVKDGAPVSTPWSPGQTHKEDIRTEYRARIFFVGFLRAGALLQTGPRGTYECARVARAYFHREPRGAATLKSNIKLKGLAAQRR